MKNVSSSLRLFASTTLRQDRLGMISLNFKTFFDRSSHGSWSFALDLANVWCCHDGETEMCYRVRARVEGTSGISLPLCHRSADFSAIFAMSHPSRHLCQMLCALFTLHEHSSGFKHNLYKTFKLFHTPRFLLFAHSAAAVFENQ